MAATHDRAEEAAAVIGATGGIGAALADRLTDAGYGTVHRVARRGPIRCDLAEPATFPPAVDAVLAGPPLTCVVIATGLLHDVASGSGPEKSLRDLDPAWLHRQFAVNAIGPALVLRTLLPRLPRDRSVRVAVLGARVGSISDNRLGGWYGYRASKAALHQLVRTAAVEWARSHRQGVLAVLHPGTVDTPLSAPFTRSASKADRLTPDQSATALLAVVNALDPAQSGRIFDWQGAEISP